jgi:hypothetical protein
MRTQKAITILAISGAALLMAACGKTEKNTSEQTTVTENNEALKSVLTGYLEVKDALVNDDAAKAKEAAAALTASTGEYADSLNESLEAIAATDDIEKQRAAFETLSMNLYDIAKQGNIGMTVYKQYCPMAFNDKGAFWLSDDKKVMNPYFGASMLRCGSVKEELK